MNGEEKRQLIRRLRDLADAMRAPDVLERVEVMDGFRMAQDLEHAADLIAETQKPKAGTP